MIFFKKYGHFFKYIIFTVGLLTLIGSLWLFSTIISSLEEKAQKNFKFQIEVFESFLKSSNSQDITFLFQNLVSNTVYPVIYTTGDTVPLYHANLELDYEPNETELKQNIKQFLVYAKPIPVRYEDQILGYYCYGEPKDLAKLKWLPFVISFLVLLLIWIAYQGFRIIKNNEAQHLWVGMSKETAHQLGTPISSLYGWLELLKGDTTNLKLSLPEIEKDLERLKTVSQRFGKIGSQPKLDHLDLNIILTEVTDYFSLRSNAEINFQGFPTCCIIQGSEDLLFWVFENLIRNSIDSGNADGCKINFTIEKSDHSFEINICDNGSGIELKKQKFIFDPGFSTKKRGWGLGLSLAKRIIEEYHDGKLFLKHSDSLKGTNFQISLKEFGV